MYGVAGNGTNLSSLAPVWPASGGACGIVRICFIRDIKLVNNCLVTECPEGGGCESLGQGQAASLAQPVHAGLAGWLG